ncbi:autotransporter-associated beta strand protein [Bradyrhizobium sp. S3.3.6]
MIALPLAVFRLISTASAASPAGRRRRQAAAALLAGMCLAASNARAQDATWLSNPGSGSFNTAANWTPAAVPTGTAFFGATSTPSISFVGDNTVGGFTFNGGASNYNFSGGGLLTFNGAGIVINGGSATFANAIDFIGAGTTAGSATLNGGVDFFQTSTAGTATINVSAGFFDHSTAGNATFTAGSSLFLDDHSTGGNSHITNSTDMHLAHSASGGDASITNMSSGSILFRDSSTAGNARITNSGIVEFGIDGGSGITNSTAGSATISNVGTGQIVFTNTASAGNATIANNGTTFGAEIDFGDSTTAGNATITNNVGIIRFGASSTAGNATIVNNAVFDDHDFLVFRNNSTAGAAIIITNAGSVTGFGDSATGGTARLITNANGFLDMSGLATGGMTAGSIEGAGTYFLGANQLIVGGNDLSTVVSGVISDGGAGGGAGGSLVKVGAGTLILSGINTYTGATAVNGGTLEVSGSIASTSSATAGPGGVLQVDNGGALGTAPVALSGGSLRTNFNGTFANSITFSAGALSSLTAAAGTQVMLTGPASIASGATAQFGSLTDTGTVVFQPGSGTIAPSAEMVVAGGKLIVNGSLADAAMSTVNSGATLGGTGTLGNTTVASGGTFAPGNGTAGSSMTVAGNLAFQSGALYLVSLNATNSSLASVTGTSTLDGSVGVSVAAGTTLAKKYTILTAAGGVSGSFTDVATLGLPAGASASLSYDSNNAYLNFTLDYSARNKLNINQTNVANALANFFNTNGGIAAAYASLSPNGLTQASGESATGAQQTTFNAMNLFLGLLTDPFIAGRDGAGSGTRVTPFAEQSGSLGYAAKPDKDPRDALAAIYAKAPPRGFDFDHRWNVWAAGYGGSQATDGNAALGSNNASSSIYGTAVGLDYRFSASTIAGMALAGGGTSFSVGGLGWGRSDLFQAGVFLRHTVGPAYLSAALAYGWQDATTDRIVTAAGIDHLRAEFNANTFAGRLEGGYRYVTPWMDITPYAAAQVTNFGLPSYAESVVSGGGAFALAQAAKSVTDTRSELGFRSDRSFAMENAVLTLRGRLAWAHDFNPDRSVGAVFQALPGAAFVVNGARQASDSAVTTVAAETKWLDGWSAAATFEGEFSNVTRSYAGKGVVRYAW